MSRNPESNPKSVRVPRWAIVLAIVIALPLVIYGVADSVAGRRVSAVKERWAADGLSFGELTARYPDEPSNEAAHRVEALAGKLGVDMVPKAQAPPNSKPQSPAQRAAAYPVKTEVAEYLDRELSAEVGVASPAPPEVAAFLDEHAAELDELVAALAGGEVPRWFTETSKGIEAPVPNLLGHITLQKLFAAAALHRTSEGRSDDALRVLDASWTLNQSIRERPELISRLIALASAKYQLGTLRKIEGVPAAWDERIESLDTRALMRESLQFEAGSWLSLPRNASALAIGPANAPSVRDRLLLSLGRPYLELSGAASADRIRVLVATDRALGACVEDAAKLESKLPPTSSWNVVATIASPNLGNTLHRAGRSSFDAELTRHVLRARAERAARVVTGPCPQWTFKTEVLPDGRMSVSYDGPAVTDPTTGVALPVRWVERPEAEVAVATAPVQ